MPCASTALSVLLDDAACPFRNASRNQRFLDVRASHYHTIKISYALCKHGICHFYCMALLIACAHYIKNTPGFLPESVYIFQISFFSLLFSVYRKIISGKLHILYQFQRAKIFLFRISDGIIRHQHFSAIFVHPDRHPVHGSRTKFLDNSSDLLFNFRRMTGIILR